MFGHVRLPAGDGDKKSLRQAFACMFVCLLVSLSVCSSIIMHKTKLQTLSLEQVMAEKSLEIHRVVARLLAKTQALAAFVIQSNGNIQDFDRFAAAILDDPAILNILVAPAGIVRGVFPLAGNEKLLGYSLLGLGAGNREAVKAMEEEELVFSGPFELMQGGGLALAGRLPVYLRAGGERTFWGLVSVTLKYPKVLEAAGLDAFSAVGGDYELWRVNPDDNKRQIIAASGVHPEGTRHIERHISFFNTDWYFRILPVRAWHEQGENWLLLLTGCILSTLVSLLVYSNSCLRRAKCALEWAVHTDSLTGVLNRAGLFHKLDDLVRDRVPFHVYYFDLNHFKQINDTFGHATGDEVLRTFCRRFTNHLDASHIFSRIGGDEFVLVQLAAAVSDARSRRFWEEIKEEFSLPLYAAGDALLRLTFSTGVASFPEDGETIDALIICADMRMYEQKHAKYSREKRRRATDIAQEGRTLEDCL